MNHEEPGESQPETGKTITIEVMNGPEDGRLVMCKKAPISIGRAPDNVVRLSYDHLISRHHARILRSEERFILRDLKSTNGTFIGRKKIQKDLPIEFLTLFRVGATVLRIRSGSTDEPHSK